MTTCTECGFVYEDHDPREAAELIRRSARELRQRLGNALLAPGGLAALRHRSAPGVWSALEYAGHVRDVLLVQHDRFYLALIEELPRFSSMYRDERAVLAAYNSEDPATTGTEVVIAADLLCRGFALIDGAQWERTLLYGSPEPRERTVAWLAQNAAHECVHHLGDVDAALTAAPSR